MVIRHMEPKKSIFSPSYALGDLVAVVLVLFAFVDVLLAHGPHAVAHQFLVIAFAVFDVVEDGEHEGGVIGFGFDAVLER